MADGMRAVLDDALSVSDTLCKRTLDADVAAYELRRIMRDDVQLSEEIERVNELTAEAKFAAAELRAAIRARVDC